jgi:hypothetical protein
MMVLDSHRFWEQWHDTNLVRNALWDLLDARSRCENVDLPWTSISPVRLEIARAESFVEVTSAYVEAILSSVEDRSRPGTAPRSIESVCR